MPDASIRRALARLVLSMLVASAGPSGLVAGAQARPDASAEERRNAAFYHLADVGNAGRYEEALELGKAYLEAYPEHATATYVLFFQGVYFSRLGRAEEARAAWEAVIAKDPDADLAGHARTWLGIGAAPAAAPAPSASADVTDQPRPIPPRASAGKVLVVGLDLDAEDPEGAASSPSLPRSRASTRRTASSSRRRISPRSRTRSANACRAR